jgi:hypothetical protein
MLGPGNRRHAASEAGLLVPSIRRGDAMSSIVPSVPCRGLALLTVLAAAALPASGQTLSFDVLGEGAFHNLGTSLAAIDDVDGDGVRDLVVGTQGGRYHVVSGVDGSVVYSVTSLDIGRRLDVIGDIDGDGIGEVINGEPGTTHDHAQQGAITVRSGADGTLLYTVYGGAALEHLGESLAAVGDVDGDGFGDFVGGAPDGNIDQSGLIRVYSGVDGSQLYERSGSGADAHFGFSVGGAGDVDGDGLADVVAGSPWHQSTAGIAQVFSGPAGTLLHTSVGAPGDRLGYDVDGAGDVDGDGRGDVVVGAPAVGYGGVVRVLSGVDFSVLHTFEGDAQAIELGLTVSGAGDVDGDGHDDVLAASFRDDAYASRSGSAHVHSGADGALLFSVYGESFIGELGVAVADLGDLDGDGAVELGFGERNYGSDGLSQRGRVRVLTWAGGAHATTFCVSGPNSSGGVARIRARGTTSVSTGGLVLNVASIPIDSGTFFYGPSEAQLPFGNGTLCVGPPFYRLGWGFGGGAQGRYGVPFAEPPVGAGPGAILAGSTWKFQAWFRDPAAGGATFDTSDGVSIEFIP